jgi:hypothetical protein
MVKFLVLNSLLFKPKYKFLTSFKAFQKKDRKVVKPIRFYQKEVFPVFSLNKFLSRSNKLLLKTSLNGQYAFSRSSLDVKKSLYNLMKIANINRNKMSFLLTENDKVRSYALKVQSLCMYNSSAEHKKRFLKSILHSALLASFVKMKKKDYFSAKDKLVRFTGKNSNSSKKEFDFEPLFIGLSRFKLTSSSFVNSFFLDSRKKEMLKTFKQCVFVHRVIRSRIFLFSLKFSRLYKKNYNFLQNNKHNLLKVWSMFLESEKTFFRSTNRKNFQIKKLAVKRRQRRKWKSFLWKYRFQLKMIRNFYPPKEFEINYKTFGFSYLGDNLLTADSKTPFELEIRKLLTFLSS